MFKIIVIVLAVVVIGIVIVIALQPAEFRVARSATMAAPAPAVFAQVNDFHKWRAWNPWGKIDPAMKQSYAGAPSGTGTIYTWSGNKQVGEGRMTIIESRPSDLIRHGDSRRWRCGTRQPPVPPVELHRCAVLGDEFL